MPSREINDLANLAFISAKTNNWIKAKSPETYIPELINERGKGIFESQCIPTDLHLLGHESYNEFLDERRSLIATKLNKFLDIKTPKTLGVNADEYGGS